MHQNTARVEDEIAAIGAMQGTWFDQAEVGGERAELRKMLDAAKQVLMRGMILIDNRCALIAASVDQKVDAIVAITIGGFNLDRAGWSP